MWAPAPRAGAALALLLLQALVQLPCPDAQAVDVGCKAVSVVGRVGSTDFINGVYDRMSAPTNGRATFRSRDTIPSASSAVFAGRTLYLYWFERGSEQDWSIGLVPGSATSVFAFASDDVLFPELIDQGLWQVLENPTSAFFEHDPVVDVNCVPDPIVPKPSFRLDLQTAANSSGLSLMRGAELTFLCNGVDGISPPLFDYYIYMVDEQGWRNCDVTTAARIQGIVGRCVTGGDPLSVSLYANPEGIPADRAAILDEAGSTFPGFLLGQSYYFITVARGSGQRFGGSPSEPGAGGLCQTNFMKIRVTVFADTEVPEVLFCPGNRAVSADAGSASSTTATWADPIAVDNVDVLSITRVAGPASGGAFPIGDTLVLYRILDTSSNEAECSFTVTVDDAEHPVFTSCPSATIRVTAAAGERRALATWPAIQASDNAGVETLALSHYPDTYFPLGLTHATAVARDANGNAATCGFTVEVSARPFVHAVSPQTLVAKLGHGVVLESEVSGTAPLSYQWLKDGVAVGGAQDSSLVIGEMSASDAGAYTLSIANNIGSTLLTPGAAVQLDDNPPENEAFVYVKIVLAPLAASQVVRGGAYEQTICSSAVYVGGESSSSCDVLSATVAPSSTAAQPAVLVDARVLCRASDSAAVRSNLQASINSGGYASELAVEQPLLFSGVGAALAGGGTATSIMPHADLCAAVICPAPPACRARGGSCRGGVCPTIVVDDLTPCTASSGATGFCFAGSCVLPAAPSNCSLSQWTAWAFTDATKAKARRTRTVQTQPFDGGLPCGSTKEEQSCVGSSGSTSPACIAAANNLGSASSSGSGELDWLLVAVCAGGGLALIVLVVLVVILARRRRRAARSGNRVDTFHENQVFAHQIVEAGGRDRDHHPRLGRDSPFNQSISSNGSITRVDLEGLPGHTFQRTSSLTSMGSRSGSRSNTPQGGLGAGTGAGTTLDDPVDANFFNPYAADDAQISAVENLQLDERELLMLSPSPDDERPISVDLSEQEPGWTGTGLRFGGSGSSSTDDASTRGTLRRNSHADEDGSGTFQPRKLDRETTKF